MIGGDIVGLIGLIVVLLGFAGLLAPRAMWWLEIGWKLQDAEPSELALILNRVMGVVCIIVGLMILFGNFNA
jgi:hypothetical protein